jgi:excisionase family DNA binding protein
LARKTNGIILWLEVHHHPAISKGGGEYGVLLSQGCLSRQSGYIRKSSEINRLRPQNRKGNVALSRQITAFLKGYPNLLTVKDMQTILNIGRTTAYSLLQSGSVKSLKIGAVYRIPKAYLHEYLSGKSS